MQRLRDAGVADETIFDIAATAAGRAFFTKVLDAVGSMPDAAFGRIEEELRVPLTVGHAISGDPVEIMNNVTI